MKILTTNHFLKSISNYLNSYNPLTIYYWKDRWWDLKWAIWALFKYFRITTQMIPWDSESVLKMMNFQIGILADYIEKKGHEIDESRLPKVEKMKRFIELSRNQLNDDFYERCGYDHNYKIEFKEIPGSDNFEMVDNETEDQKKINGEAIKKGQELEEAEWNEMIETLRDMRSWWD